MNALNIPQHLVQSIGWTLIHSLWQGLLIYIVLKMVLRWTNRADFRYGMGVVAMAMIVISSLCTFFVLTQGTASPSSFELIQVSGSVSGQGQESASFISTALNVIDQNIIWLIRFWMLGFVAGLLRIAAGLWYIGRLRKGAHPVQDEWMEMLKRLSASLNITRMVTMAEATISSPMVVGFMKPMVLFPAGLLAGLSIEQVETILVHELSHIRRQDYIINLVQAIVETIFFFNPFALLISSLIREERENCCDDVVIASGISPISYVKTLAQLEASRSSSPLVLGIAGNQNQLLNRIKRIMENSAKNDWGKGRLAPVALLFLGLICASWLSIGSEKEITKAETNTNERQQFLAADTSREDGLKVIKRGKQGWTYDEPVPPVPSVEPVPEIEFIPDMEFDVQLDPEAFVMPEALVMPEILMTPGVPFEWDGFDRFGAFGDSIPGLHFRTRDIEDWAAFEKEFTEKFRTQFKDFYEKNEEQMNKLMEELKQAEIKKRRDAAEVVDLDMLRREADFNAKISRGMANISRDKALLNEKLFSIQAEEAMKKAGMQMKMNMDQFRVMEEQLRENKLIFEDMARKADEYNEALTKMLREDGYIKAGEKIDNFNINDNNGELIINGHKIKESDQVRYRALHDQYFSRWRRESRHRSE